MTKKEQTIATYNQKAEEFAARFNKLGTRTTEIEEVFRLVGKGEPVVFEIGCANGREAVEVIKRTPHYTGIDIAEKLIEIARENLPQGHFEVADVESYGFPQGIDIVLAFASLIHVPKEKLEAIFHKLYLALNSGGMIYLSMKSAPQYTEVTKEDEFGVRTTYLYSVEEIAGSANGFKIIRTTESYKLEQDWFEMILQKK